MSGFLNRYNYGYCRYRIKPFIQVQVPLVSASSHEASVNVAVEHQAVHSSCTPGQGSCGATLRLRSDARWNPMGQRSTPQIPLSRHRATGIGIPSVGVLEVRSKDTRT